MSARWIGDWAVLLLFVLAPSIVYGAGASKILRYALEIPETSFDPVEISDAASHGLLANILDTPLAYDYLARPVKLRPNTLVEMPEITGNGTIYTMRVKAGIYFQLPPSERDVFHGKRRELTASDYVYSIKRVFDPRKRSPNLFFVEGVIAGMDEVLARSRKEGHFDYDAPVEGLRVVDKYTFQIRLKAPNYNFIYLLAYCPVSCAVAREVVDLYGDRTAEHPVGTGPYMLVFWKRSARMVFEANPSYREEYFDAQPVPGDMYNERVLSRNKGKRLPMIDRIEVNVIEQQQPRYLAFINKEFDLLRLPPEFANVAIPGNELASHLARHGVQMQRTPAMDLTYTYFGMNDPIVGGYEPAKVALRRAIVLAQDIEAEIHIVRKNQAIVAHSPIAPGASGYDPAFHSSATDYSPAKAKALLDMYGYVDCDGDGYRDLPRTSSADRCTPFSLQNASGPTLVDTAMDENWKKNMDAIGIRMTFKKASWPDLLKESKAGKLQMARFSWVAPFPDADAFFVMLYGPNAGQANHSRFHVEAFDRLYEKARRLPPGDERAAIYREMNRIFLVYAPWRLGVHRMGTDLMQPWVVGFSRHPVMLHFWKYVDIDLAIEARRRHRDYVTHN